jgi:Protein of unknown function (DUF3043)
MKVLLRRRGRGSTATPDSDQVNSAADQTARPAGKGRPTPKRSEVERARRQPYTPPSTDRKAASAQQRERRRAEQKRKMDAMKRGEEWAMPARDRGPVRALVRDYVDSRRFILSEYILFGVFALIFVIFASGSSKNSALVLYVELGIVAVIALESLWYGAQVTRLVKRRLPGESTRGILWYVTKRSLRLRASRIPPARVQRGAPI